MAKDLNKLSTEELGQLFPIILSEHDPGWSELYENEKILIIASFHKDNILNIDHIGSTAVPGLIAKPTIDILIQIQQNCNLKTLREDLKRAGYDLIPKPENPPPHMMYAKGYTKTGVSGQTFHLHIRFKGDWDEIVFRDYLIAVPEIAREYADLKIALAERFPNDREKYTESKGEFVRKIIQLARGKS